MKHKIYINETIYCFEYNSKQTFVFNSNPEKNLELNTDEMNKKNYIMYSRTKQTVETHRFIIAVSSVNLDVTCSCALLLANSKLVDKKNLSLEKKRGCVIPIFNFPNTTNDGSEASKVNHFDVINSIVQGVVYATMIMEDIIHFFEMNALSLLKVGVIIGAIMLMKWIIDKIRNRII
jgi:hypothetical protein